MTAAGFVRHPLRGPATARAVGAALALVAALSMLGLHPPAAAAASAKDANGDRAAALAYLQAGYRLERATVANLTNGRASVRALDTRLDGECPGVLAGAPRLPAATETPRPAARKRLELDYESFEVELQLAAVRALVAPTEGAFATFANTVAALHWHNRATARGVAAEVASLRAALTAPPPDVCADLRAWVASGYATLPAATLAAARGSAESSSNTPGQAEIEAAFASRYGGSLSSLQSRTEALRRGVATAYNDVLGLIEPARKALGLPGPVAPPVRPPLTRVASGHTPTGRLYVVFASKGGRCATVLLIRERLPSGNGYLLYECLRSAGGEGPVAVDCSGGILRIHGPVAASAARARLLLAGGRTITSAVVHVAAAQGGPTAFFYQALPGSSRRPVSLTILDAHGRTLRPVALTAPRRCPA